MAQITKISLVENINQKITSNLYKITEHPVKVKNAESILRFPLRLSWVSNDYFDYSASNVNESNHFQRLHDDCPSC